MTDCIFCKIGAGALPSDTVYEDGEIKVFKDLHPKAPVHLLVIPKEHVESVAHLANDHAPLVGRLVLAAKAVAKDMGLTGFKLVCNVGRDGGQVIDHLHIHLLAGWKVAEERTSNV